MALTWFKYRFRYFIMKGNGPQSIKQGNDNATHPSKIAANPLTINIKQTVMPKAG